MIQGALLGDVRELIASARRQTATSVNAALTMLYWQVGERIRREVLREKRAEYGQEIVHALSGQLSAEFGSGFRRANLFTMLQFAELFPDSQIVAALRQQLGWTLFKLLIPLKEPLKRDF